MCLQSFIWFGDASSKLRRVLCECSGFRRWQGWSRGTVNFRYWFSVKLIPSWSLICVVWVSIGHSGEIRPPRFVSPWHSHVAILCVFLSLQQARERWRIAYQRTMLFYFVINPCSYETFVQKTDWNCFRQCINRRSSSAEQFSCATELSLRSSCDK